MDSSIITNGSIHGPFNGQFLFVLGFLIKVLLVFLAGGIIGNILHLDRAYKSGPESGANNMTKRQSNDDVYP